MPQPTPLRRSSHNLTRHAIAQSVAESGAAVRAVDLDRDDAFPSDAVETLSRSGLLAAREFLNVEDASDAALLCFFLRAVGRANLPLGRVVEGHINALQLVRRYGTPAQAARSQTEAADGHLFGVWNTEEGDGLMINPAPGGAWTLEGGKIFASAAGHLTRGLVTARRPDGERVMVLASLAPGERANLSAWRASGMRASATGRIDLTGLRVRQEDIIGEPGDYTREPTFSAGAWRFAAVQQGGCERILEILVEHLRACGREGDPHQQARVGRAAVAVETARLWVERASEIAHGTDAGAAVAYVGLTRTAVEVAALEVMELAQRSVGLAGQMRCHPLERAVRDLSTYLRQPAPDRALTKAAEFMLSARQPAHDLWDSR